MLMYGRLMVRTRKPAVSEADLHEAAEMFKTLSDPTRLRILTALAEGAACVHELCARLQMSQTAVSHQLRLLRVSRLVRGRRAGREIFYSLEDEHVMSLVAAACSHAGERR
jgi:ArsR family transcriptional regulator, lead/cadmium/zinc/bismuth-responsive transcriptional repressor